MGRHYSIKSYIKTEKISDCLNWVYENSWVYDDIPLNIKIQDEILKIKGDFFNLDNYVSGNYLNKEKTIIEFKELHFSTSLIFDIDPEIIESIASRTLHYGIEFLEDFKQDFEDVYLGNGKIRIGGFDSSIIKLNNSNIYEIEFIAVASSISDILANSIAVKKWIIEFSKYSDSIISFLDFESQSFKILYFNKDIVEIELNEDFLTEIQSHQNIYPEIFYYALIKKVKTTCNNV